MSSMSISIFSLFTIGIGPSSSHTVGPMRAARLFANALQHENLIGKTTHITAELFGSLGLTGKGHGSDKAVLLGLEGETPETVNPDTVPEHIKKIRANASLNLLGIKSISFTEKTDLVFHRSQTLASHSNGLIFTANDANGALILKKTYYSIGGGFVVSDNNGKALTLGDERDVPYPFQMAADLLTVCEKENKSIAEAVFANETSWRTPAEINAKALEIWSAMQACVARGLKSEGLLPGGLKVKRRAPDLHQRLISQAEKALKDPLTIMDWVNLYALAVNEENAAGGRVVTAPTNGAAGIIPAVLHYLNRFTPHSSEDDIIKFLLTAGAIGLLYKRNASISGAEVGCQGEVGVACSMAAAGLTAALGGTNAQIENAAEIGMEHNLGLTCDPVGGLVQIPCIERNAMGAMKAINASRIALSGDGTHKVSLDRVIQTMFETGRDMQTKYKETSQGGLATNVVEC